MSKTKSKWHKLSPDRFKTGVGGVKTKEAPAKTEPAVAVVETPAQVKDLRLDELIPLIVKVITRLLSSAGMMRYRTDFAKEVKEIMRKGGGEGKK